MWREKKISHLPTTKWQGGSRWESWYVMRVWIGIKVSTDEESCSSVISSSIMRLTLPCHGSTLACNKQMPLSLTSFLSYLFAVGSPIAVKQSSNPTAEEIEQLHQTYLQELKTLFEEHKGKYGIPQHETLVFE